MDAKDIKPGYVYHIKDSYFDVAQDEKLMKNHSEEAVRFDKICTATPWFAANKEKTMTQSGD
jgi:hypothetical protein